MKPIQTFKVAPSLPPPLEPLSELAHNLWWCWNHSAIELFRRLDGDLWEATGHNPVLLLDSIDQAQLEAASNDGGFLAHLDRVTRDFRAYMTGATPKIGHRSRTRARVQLAALSPHDVSVELYVGRVDAEGQLVEAKPVPCTWWAQRTTARMSSRPTLPSGAAVA